MAKHKAPSEVTVAPLFEKSTAEQMLDKFKVPAAVAVLAVVALVLFWNMSKKNAARALDESWAALIDQTEPDPYTRLPSADPEVLASLAGELKGRESGPWARLLEVNRRMEDRDFKGALQAIETLRSDYPDHALVQSRLPNGDEESTVVDHLESSARAQMTWESEHPGIFANPAPPQDATSVVLNTSAGKIEVALYDELAAEHAKNFVKLCGEGFYDGIKFHRVVPGFMIQGGDPNTRDEDKSLWGQGGPGYTIPAEETGLFHFGGVLSAAKKPGETESSGSQFFITTDPAHHLDGQHVVFGAVTSGRDVVAAICGAATEPDAPERPVAPVTIESTEVQ